MSFQRTHTMSGARGSQITTSRGPHRRPARLLALLLVGALATGTAAQTWLEALRAFDVTQDVPAQREALLALEAGLGGGRTLLATARAADVLGSPGIAPWGADSVSYCTWWGVNCCGTTLTTSLELCAHGTNSVSGLHLSAVNLTGALPDVFDRLPDLHIIDISFNRGARMARRMARMAAWRAAWRRAWPRAWRARTDARASTPPRRPLPRPRQACAACCPRASRSSRTCGCWTRRAQA